MEERTDLDIADIAQKIVELFVCLRCFVLRILRTDHMEQVEKCCKLIADLGIDITATYDEWFHVGAALASLGERGRSLFHLVSLQNAKYKAAETDKKFDNLLRNVISINIGTFFHICSLHGINWKEGSL